MSVVPIREIEMPFGIDVRALDPGFAALADVVAEATALTAIYGPNVLDQVLQDAEETHRYSADEDPEWS